MIVCTRCGRESPDEERFCASCGTALAPVVRREERKVVTVVFADLVGSTAAAELSDPEDVRAMLAAHHARVRAELERFGGTVEKFIGDAVMAVVGAPVVHEDDHERAVRAALAIRDVAVEVGVELRVAVNTGEALVSLDARPAEGEGMVAGDVVNTAARFGPDMLEGCIAGEALGLGAELRPALRNVVGSSPWVEACARVVEGRLEEAGDLMHAREAYPSAALVRLLAAERAGRETPGLREAVSFYESVAATAYLARAERLLQASA